MKHDPGNNQRSLLSFYKPLQNKKEVQTDLSKPTASEEIIAAQTSQKDKEEYILTDKHVTDHHSSPQALPPLATDTSPPQPPIDGLSPPAAVLQPTAAAKTQPKPPPCNTNGMTEYEIQRLERIQRNKEAMRALGLGDGGGSSLFLDSNKKTGVSGNVKRAPKRKQPRTVTEPAAGVRRSSRQRGSVSLAEDDVENHGNAFQQIEPPPPEAEVKYDYDTSMVHHYLQQTHSTHLSSSSGTVQIPDDASITGLAQTPGCLYDSKLKQAYSVDYWQAKGLIAAAGKEGIVSVWGSRQLEDAVRTLSTSSGDEEEEEEEDLEVEALLSDKLHRSWISDVQFVQTSTTHSDTEHDAMQGVLVLTSANDGTVNLWDLSQTASTKQLPRPVCTANTLHSSGIFSMHEQGLHVLTGSKDTNVVVSHIDNSGSLSAIRTFEGMHDGVVKCVRWQPSYAANNSPQPFAFASCGNDGAVKVTDIRNHDNNNSSTSHRADIVIEGDNCHTTAVHSVRWSPTNEHMLLSASHDPFILVHDLRKPSVPLFTLTGHSSERRIATMYQPAFVWAGDAIATTSCDNKQKTLVLYCCKTGKLLSRGAVDINIGALFCGGCSKSDALLCTSNKSVYMYTPCWQSGGGGGGDE